MNREFASSSNRQERKIPVPTQAEYALVKSRGLNGLSSTQLAQMRAEARAAKRTPVTTAAKPVAAKAAPAGTLLEQRLKRQVERLKNEVCNLKLRILLKT